MPGLFTDKLKSAGNSKRKSGNSFKESNVDKGMVLPFTPLTMTFNDVHYFVDCPAVSAACKAPSQWQSCYVPLATATSVEPQNIMPNCFSFSHS